MPSEQQIRAVMRARIAELAPLAEEYQRLVSAEALLEGEPVAALPDRPDLLGPEPEPEPDRRGPKPGRPMAPRGSRERQIFDYFAEHPGAARATEIAATTGIGMHLVGVTMARLVKKGQVIKRAAPTKSHPRAVVYELPGPQEEEAPAKPQIATLRILSSTRPTPRELHDRRVAFVTSEG